MLTVFLAGRGEYRRANVRTSVERGFVGLVPPDDPGILMADPEDPYVHLYCRFGGSFAVALAERIIAENGSRFFRSSSFFAVAGHLRRIGHVGQSSRRDSPGFHGRDIRLLEALVLLQGTASARAHVSGDDIRHYLMEHLDQPTDLDRMARDLAVSRSTLCRRARHDLGSSVQQVHEREKIRWAETLLRETELTIGEIAAHVGYSDGFYFSRVFKKQVGVSPRAYRRQTNGFPAPHLRI
jgi:AraC-like DNA-binding protein